MAQTPNDCFTQLVHELSKLPGIGEKSATRMAYHLLSADDERIRLLVNALTQAKTQIRLCQQCFTYTDTDVCGTCADSARSLKQICVVDKPSDMRAIEGSGKYKGSYHVLHGLLSPVDGVGPDQIKIAELLRRLQSHTDQGAEVILALNPSVEGEATALYITRLLKPMSIRVSKIAYGLPMGGSLEYADRGTIGRALENRTDVH